MLTHEQVGKLIYTPQPDERITIWRGNPYTGKLVVAKYLSGRRESSNLDAGE